MGVEGTLRITDHVSRPLAVREEISRQESVAAEARAERFR